MRRISDNIARQGTQLMVSSRKVKHLDLHEATAAESKEIRGRHECGFHQTPSSEHPPHQEVYEGRGNGTSATRSPPEDLSTPLQCSDLIVAREL